MIFDVVLLPEYQGRGIGKQIMKFLTELSKAPAFLLYTMPGKEGFYAKLGYRKMKTAMAKFPDPGMQQKAGYIERLAPVCLGAANSFGRRPARC